MKFATWETASLNRLDAVEDLEREVEKPNIGHTALQEVRWKGQRDVE